MKNTSYLPNRREFLLAAAGATIPLTASKKNHRLKLAIVGCGDQGTNIIYSLLAQNPGGNIAAICDINPDTLTYAKNTIANNGLKTYQSYDEMLRTCQIDGLFIATPPNLHFEMICKALKREIDCYCEKPLCLSLNDIDYIATLKGKAILQVGLQLRYAEEMQSLPDVGNIQLITAYRTGPDANPSKKWMFDKNQSGDLPVEQCVHEFDIFNTLMGGLPLKVEAFGATILNHPLRNTIDHFAATLYYGNGEIVSYSNCRFANSSQQIKVLGTKGHYVIEFKNRALALIKATHDFTNSIVTRCEPKANISA